MLPFAGLLALIVALDAGGAPDASPAPLKEIYRAKVTPFCSVFRENVFRAVQGLMVNDEVIAQGGDLMRQLGREGYGHAMAQYQLGQTVYQAASNLVKVYQLLDDPRFPQHPVAAEDRDLLLMKARLEAVADAQERSLNVLSGTYETSALNDFAFKGREDYTSLVDTRPTRDAEDRVAPAVLPGINRCK